MSDMPLVHTVRPPAPDANPTGTRPPLLLLLHGVGSNERSLSSLAASADPRLMVVSVRSPIELGPDAFGWFHVTFTPTGPVIDQGEASDGWTMIARFIDDAVERYDTDPDRVYVAGFSQGGIMSLAALLTAPERVAGAACLSGRLLPEVLPHLASAEALRGKPVLVVHGTADEKLGIHFARQARETLSTVPVALTYRELPMGHTISPAAAGELSAWLAEQLDAAAIA